RLAATADFELDCGPTHVRVTLRGEDVTEAIRSMRVNDHTRYIANSPGVREILVQKQREIGDRLGSMVTEGRDQGSVAFPHAALKFFLVADLDTRAARRFHEISADGEDTTLETVKANLATRDASDSGRSVGALREPPDAVRIDTTRLTIPQVVDLLLTHIAKAGVPVPDPRASEAAS
ncbi:MAG: (d)CMP kinase, partial [Phycisphaerales bacterium]|nr:(d)CMP kinase [Phycisphaerales bacterium]